MNDFAVETDITKYRRVMADLADAAGARGENGPKFVKKQGALLVETLMKVSPPQNRAKSREKIETNVTRKFNAVGAPDVDYSIPTDSKHGTNDVHWYLWTPYVLIGVAKDADLTKANGDELWSLYWKINRKGQLQAGNHGKQKIRIWQKITVKRSASKKLIARLIRHLGRQKAGYLPAFDELHASGNIYRPPQWVTIHRTGARGSFNDETATPQKPSVVIRNFANGIGKTAGIVKAALNIRMKAMAADRMLYIRGVKEKYGV